MNLTTLKQIAEEAGVSVQTVANVLSRRNKEHWASVAERAQRIRDIAARLDYRPNAAAKSMRTQRTQQIGVLIRNEPRQRFRNIKAFETILGINEELEKADYLVSLVRVGDVRNSVRMQSRVFRERLLDGLIVLSAMPADVQRVVEELIPKCVWVDTNRWRGHGVIRRDERHAGRLACEALAELGYRQIVWFGRGGTDTSGMAHFSEKDRLAGVSEVARKRSLDLQVLPITRKSVYRRPERLGQWLRPDVGIVAYSTSHARWLAHHAATLGLRPGYDFGLVCCDDSHDTSIQWPSLSRVSFDRFRMGVRAAKMMLQLLQGEACPSRKIRGRWHAGSTAWGPTAVQPFQLSKNANPSRRQPSSKRG